MNCDPLDGEKLIKSGNWYDVMQPYMEKAFLRFFFNPAFPCAEECPNEYLRTIFAPPADFKEAMTMHVADIITYRNFEKKKTLKMARSVISKALPEIEEAYNVILQDGGAGLPIGEKVIQKRGRRRW